MEELEVGIFQHDNARPHAARVTREFLADNEVTVMDWPAYSPDLNPIEHLWDILGRRVMERGPANRNHLIQLLHQEWEAIPQEEIRRLIDRLRRRCAACIRADGGHIPC
jgi:transposase